MPVLHTLSQLNILHYTVQVLRAGLFIAFIVQMILSFVVRDQDNRFVRFVGNITGPLVNPFDKLIPPVSIGGMSLSLGFIAGWFALTLGAGLLLQALPPGW
ncbi:MAG TPA: YggT family protein [Ktedonobacterales bacterium]|jgi:uncharacterized protein YggT (Ycf19 family)